MQCERSKEALAAGTKDSGLGAAAQINATENSPSAVPFVVKFESKNS
jgi:hypothetical protein